MANYTYVVDSSYQPFSLQEMLVPFNAYKEAFEKSEDAYDKLSEADDFKYLSKTLPEGSAARSLYEGYANDLHSQAEDLAQNGLTMGNRRALTSLKRRYRGEIGQLVKADEALKEEKKLRQSLNAQDPERLYATENLSIDDFLEGKNPNLYSISGKDLYARGAQAAKAYSSRVFNTGEGPKTLGGYYIDWIQRNGTSNESIAAFMKNMQSIPEMYNAFNSIMKATGAEKNLSGYSLERAREEVLNGMVDGFVYQETHNPQRNLGVLTEAEKSQADLTRRGQNIQLGQYGMYYDDKTNVVHYDKNKDPRLEQAKAVAEVEKGDKSSTSEYKTQFNKRIKITWNGDTPFENGKFASDQTPEEKKENYYDDVTYTEVPDDEEKHPGQVVDYNELPSFVKIKVNKIIGKGDKSSYYYYYRPFEGHWYNDKETEVEIVPKKIVQSVNNNNTSTTPPNLLDQNQ